MQLMALMAWFWCVENALTPRLMPPTVDLASLPAVRNPITVPRGVSRPRGSVGAGAGAGAAGWDAAASGAGAFWAFWAQAAGSQSESPTATTEAPDRRASLRRRHHDIGQGTMFHEGSGS